MQSSGVAFRGNNPAAAVQPCQQPLNDCRFEERHVAGSYECSICQIGKCSQSGFQPPQRSFIRFMVYGHMHPCGKVNGLPVLCGYYDDERIGGNF